MAIKVIALGFYNSGDSSYLKNSWNVLDFVVVIGSWANMVIPGGSNISAIRTFRLLKPLKAISSIPGLHFPLRPSLSQVMSQTVFLPRISFF